METEFIENKFKTTSLNFNSIIEIEQINPEIEKLKNFFQNKIHMGNIPCEICLERNTFKGQSKIIKNKNRYRAKKLAHFISSGRNLGKYNNFPHIHVYYQLNKRLCYTNLKYSEVCERDLGKMFCLALHDNIPIYELYETDNFGNRIFKKVYIEQILNDLFGQVVLNLSINNCIPGKKYCYNHLCIICQIIIKKSSKRLCDKCYKSNHQLDDNNYMINM